MRDIPKHPDASSGLLKRLWIFQSERFPLFKTILLLAVFTSASISVSAQLAGRTLPHLSTFLLIWFITIIIFFQMRVCDEWKDLEDDKKYRPERPVPSGLISLRLLFSMALAGLLIAVGLTSYISMGLLFPLGLVWVWLALMTMEFFGPEWLKKHQLIYLISHMMIMPLIDLFITAAEWVSYSFTPPNYLWLFLVLSFLNGCVLEIGRKVWAKDNEKQGVVSYSSLWGYKKATIIWVMICTLAWFCLVFVGFATGYPLASALPGVLVLLFVYYTAYSFIKQPDTKKQKAVEDTAGLWVFACYCLAGFAPLIVGALS